MIRLLLPLGAAFLLSCSPAEAAPPTRRAVLVLLREIESEVFFRAVARPEHSELRAESAFAVMNAAIPGPKSRESAYLTVRAGRRLAGPGPAEQAFSLERLPAGRLLILELDAETSRTRAPKEVARLTQLLDPARDLLVVASPAPQPVTEGTREWNRLGPVLIWGSGWGGRIAASATTRTPGLIANIDLAPTILDHLGIPAPPGMEGHPARPAAGSLRDVMELAQHARVNREAMVPALISWGVLALASVLAVTRELLRPSGRPTARLLLTLTAAFPLAMLLASLVPAPSPIGLIIVIWALGAVIAGLAWRFRRGGPPLLPVYLASTLVILLDLYTGGRLLARNLMSDFANIGARFYGLGNEFQGLLLGAVVIAPLWLLDRRCERQLPPGAAPALGLLWMAALVGNGAPQLGADFGGALALTLTCAAAGLGLRATLTGQRIRARHVLAAAGLALVAGMALVAADLARPPDSRTHLGELAARTLEDGGVELVGVVFRKLALNVRMALTPYFLGGMAAFIPVMLYCRRRFGPAAWEALRRRPLLKVGILSALAGGVVSLVLNDTGVVSWALATGCALLCWLDVLQDTGVTGREPAA